MRQTQRAYVDLGGAYTRSLEDYPRANGTLDSFDKRYPVNIYNDEALYLRYLTALRQNKLPQAQDYSNQLQQRYPQSKWAAMVKPASDTGGLASTQVSVANFYDETYQMLMQRQYDAVLKRSVEGRQRYASEAYGNRFRIMEAISYAGSGKYMVADTLLNEFIKTHQNDSLRTWADNVLRYVQDLKKADTLNKPKTDTLRVPVMPNSALNQPSTATRGNDSTVVRATPVPATFSYKPGEEHYFVFYFNEMSSKVIGVRAALNDFNGLKFGGQNLATDIEMLQSNRKGMLVVRKFGNAAQAKNYLNEFKRNPNITREFGAGDFQVFLISPTNLSKVLADKDAMGYYNFAKSRY